MEPEQLIVWLWGIFLFKENYIKIYLGHQKDLGNGMHWKRYKNLERMHVLIELTLQISDSGRSLQFCKSILTWFKKLI